MLGDGYVGYGIEGERTTREIEKEPDIYSDIGI